MTIKMTHEFFNDINRYHWDFDICTPARGFAQVDTTQDAWYYGTWANPFSFTLVTYAEGDLNTSVADTADEFCEMIRDFVGWNNAEGLARFKGIDPMLSPHIEQAFQALGLGEFLH